MAHPLLQEKVELLALAEEIGSEQDIAEASAEVSRVLDKLAWTIAHRDCDHAYDICSHPAGPKGI
jgi:hypothetical protein